MENLQTLTVPLFPNLGFERSQPFASPPAPQAKTASQPIAQTSPADLGVTSSSTGQKNRAAFLRSLREVEHFTSVFGSIQLRQYQKAVASSIVESILGNKGLSIVVMFPRQSGKNLLQAQLEAYLMVLFAQKGAEMVKLSPTYQPQSLNAMRRLETALQTNWLTRDQWHKTAGNHYRFGNAHLTFLSAAPGSNIVGATASTLLQLDEAQDIEIEKYDKQIAPMAASTNATRIFWGTAWTSQTLLARELRLAQAAESRDGIRRVFQLSAEAVRSEVPAYGRFVDEQVARLGRSHPMVRSQYFGEEITCDGGLFNAQRLGLMQGCHPALAEPEPGKTYAMLVDLAGEDESTRQGFAGMQAGIESLANPGRDATAVTVVEVDGRLLADALTGKPCYKVVRRYLWVGEKHSSQYARLLALTELWKPRKVVVDASGVGAGLASFLADKLGERVIPLVFTRQIKSRLGWGFLAVIDTGRFQDHTANTDLIGFEGSYAVTEMENQNLQAMFQRQLAGVTYTVRPGPEHLIQWGVPEGARDPQTRDLLHDDLVLSASLVAILDEQEWRLPGTAKLIQAADPLKEMDGGF